MMGAGGGTVLRYNWIQLRDICALISAVMKLPSCCYFVSYDDGQHNVTVSNWTNGDRSYWHPSTSWEDIHSYTPVSSVYNTYTSYETNHSTGCFNPLSEPLINLLLGNQRCLINNTVSYVMVTLCKFVIHFRLNCKKLWTHLIPSKTCCVF